MVDVKLFACGSPTVVLGPAASTSLENSLAMEIPKPCSSLTESEIGMGTSNLSFKKPPRSF